MVRTHDVKSKRLSIPQLQKKLDLIFSQYIRLRDANQNGFCKCITCNCMWQWRLIHNGHYIPRQHIATRYDERNCHAQCPTCNIGLRGNTGKYKRALIERYGVKALEELESSRHAITKWTVSDYQEKISYYKNEVKRLLKEKNV